VKNSSWTSEIEIFSEMKNKVIARCSVVVLSLNEAGRPLPMDQQTKESFSRFATLLLTLFYLNLP
jgi:acyl-CoA thioesterase FadM